MTYPTIRRASLAAVAALTLAVSTTTAQSTPAPGAAGDACLIAASTPAAAMAMSADTPEDAMGMNHAAMSPDQMYIDMMIPHHAGILAMAEAALPRLEDQRLQDMARVIIAAQGPEIEELRGFRGEFFGDPEPMPMDAAMVATMGEIMPGIVGTPEEMAFQMDAAAQVAALCNAADADLAFIDLTIPHHQMAVDASESIVSQMEHPEIGALAQRVIDAQTREIDALHAIRQERFGSATPAPVTP